MKIIFIVLGSVIGTFSPHAGETADAACTRLKKELGVEQGYAGEGYFPKPGEVMAPWSYGDGQEFFQGESWTKVAGKIYRGHNIVQCLPLTD